MTDSKPKMTWTKEAEINLIMCLWYNDTNPDHKINSSKWEKIKKDSAKVQGQPVGTSALH